MDEMKWDEKPANVPTQHRKGFVEGQAMGESYGGLQLGRYSGQSVISLPVYGTNRDRLISAMERHAHPVADRVDCVINPRVLFWQSVDGW
jgi:hypothetical protein